MSNKKEPLSETESDEQLRKLVTQILTVFFVEPGGQDLLATFDKQTARVSPPIDAICAAFRSNIEGLIATISLPFTFASSAVTDQHFYTIVLDEIMKTRALEQNSTENKENFEVRRRAVATEAARKRMDEFLQSPEGEKKFVREVVTLLERTLKRNSLSGASNELVLQGLVLSWGAFEVLCRDCLVFLLNKYPRLAEALTKDGTARKRVEITKISLETLAAFDFNLSTRMGTLVAEQNDLSDIFSIKAVYKALIPDDMALRNALSDEKLRVLSQRRNVIAHRRGVIDDLYKRSVTTHQHVGEKLHVPPDELKEQIATCIEAASAVLLAIMRYENANARH